MIQALKALFGNRDRPYGASTGTQVQLMRVHCAAR